MELPDGAIKWQIKHGLKWPFFLFTTQFPSSWAAMNAIMADVSDRGGLKNAIEAIEDDERAKLRDLIDEVLMKANTPAIEKAGRIQYLLSCYRGFDQEWDGVDDDTKQEILDTWAGYITYAAEHRNALPTAQQTAQHAFVRQVESVVDRISDQYPDSVECYQAAQATASGILRLIEGDDTQKGYRLFSQEFPISSPELDLSCGLQSLFDEINS